MNLPRRTARAMLAASFIAGGVDQIRNPRPKEAPSEPVLTPIAQRIPQLPNDPEQLIKLDGAIKVAGGLALMTGRFARPSALLLAGELVPTTLAGHRFWEQRDPRQRVSDQVEFFKNVSLIGGLLLAALDTGGRPSVPWMTRRAAKLAAASVGEAAESVRETAGTVGSGVAHGVGAAAGTVGKAGRLAARTTGKAGKTSGKAGRLARTSVKAGRVAGKAGGAAKAVGKTGKLTGRAVQRVLPG